MDEGNKKVAIVTGSSSGVGRELARQLAKRGIIVVVTARRKTRLEELASEIRKSNGVAIVIPADLRVASEITHLVEKTIKEFGRIDILANIAGWGKFDYFDKLSSEELRDQFEVNVLGLAELTRQVSSQMKKQRSGHIINMSSYASRIAFPPQTVYASTKYAIEGLTDGLRRELAPWNIKVTRVHPGGITGTEFREIAILGGIYYKMPSFGQTTKEEVARRIVGVVVRPRPELLIGRVYDFVVLLNRLLPWVIDQVAKRWVSQKAKIDK